MKKNPVFAIPFQVASIISRTIPASFFCALLSTLLVPRANASDLQIIHGKISAVVTNMTPLRHASRWTQLNLSIGLPLRDREGLTNLLRELYDPASTNFHHYLSPEQFAERFGPTEQDYEAVVGFAQSQGLVVTARHPNRTLVSLHGTIADAERVFHVRMNEYQHPRESRTFFAPDREPSISLAVPVLAIGGMDNFVIPRPCLKRPQEGQAKPAGTGSGPGGTFMGNDFRAAYVPGVPLTGSGQTVGLLEFDSGYYQSDVTAYENLTGLPNVPVSAVLLNGYAGGPGYGNDEVSLDIDMAISMAPGLKGIVVYEGSSTDDILNRIVTDNLAKQIGASWTYPIDANSEQAFLQMAAQGQSFYNASGDSDAYTGTVDTPADDPNIIIVGGTSLATSGAGGAWVSERVWNWGNGVGGSGGISTKYAIPSWQQGVSMASNQGSTNFRNLPDVALTADNVYVIYGNGSSGSFGGTSCATPLWAAFTALANQLALTNGEPTIGFINPAVYAMGKGSNAMPYTSLFHDIATGNNESPSSPSKFSAVPGFDLCTGWGTPTGSNLLNALALPEPLQVSPNADAIFTGPVGGPFVPATQTYMLTNKGTGPFNWAVTSNSAWFNVSPAGGSLTIGGPAAAVTLALLPNATNFPAGSFSASLSFTNLTDNYVQTHNVTLAVVTPPAITLQPTNEALLVGMTASFNVATASNALMFYQWQENGVNLTDAGKISGSSTSTLTISNATSTNAGVYSVILSNAAGVIYSSNAVLTIVPSAPVIVQQPTNQTVLPGAPATFSVVAVGNTPYFYQWQLNGTNVANGVNFSGATGSTLTVSNVTTATSGAYSVIVTNTLGSVASTNATLSTISVTATGVTMTPLVSFAGGTQGEFPYCPLVPAAGGNFFGTTSMGGTNNTGTIFRVNTNGVLTTLYTFIGTYGSIPYGGLFLGRDGLVYGTASGGGTFADGTTFKTTSTGSFTLLTIFNGNNGASPQAGMVQASDANFYGTTYEGGAYGYGTVFRMSSTGTLTTLGSFNNTAGGYPSSALIQASDGNFYGTTENGGTNGGLGTVFRMSISGSLTVLYSFGGTNDGAIPVAGVLQGVDGNLYGVTSQGGTNQAGTIFKITTSGVFSTLYTFTGGADGANPWGGLLQSSDGNLYGCAQNGGTYGYGTAYRIAPTGTLTPLVQFEGYNGANPSAALVQGADGNLYGTTQKGGSVGFGNVYKLSFSGPLQITGQPASQSTYAGGTAIFAVATAGGAPVTYQWQQNGVNLSDGGGISGSATATLKIASVAATNNGASYSVIVSNAYNSLASAAATLQVIDAAPAITTQPVGQTLVAGGTATFSVAATGDQPLLYQWRENGTNLTDGGTLSGSATSTLTLSGVAAANTGVYSVIVSNGVSATTSSNAVLTVVPVTPPTASMTEIHLFSGGTDGAFPQTGLVQGRDGDLYGTDEGGGTAYVGTVFRMSLAGTPSTYYNFTTGTTGSKPYGRLVQSTNGLFYGATYQGGTDGYGATFKLNASGPSGSATFPYSFTSGADGARPKGGLALGADGNFYGICNQGGSSFAGSIYKMGTNGAVTALYDFTGGSDGGFPQCDLVQGADGYLYGTTRQGGAGGYGTVFKLTTNGSMTTLVSFNNINGAYPDAGVVQGADGNFYGTTFAGGTNGYGTVFSMTTNGSLTTICSLALTNGGNPEGALFLGSDGNFYGTTSTGGAGGLGTVFKITTNGALTTLIWFNGFNGANPNSTLMQASDGNFYGTTPLGGNGYNQTEGGGNGTVYRLTVPAFINNPFSVTSAVACFPYAGTISGNAIAPGGDAFTYGKVGGPAWLNVATNGALSGTPTNSNVGTNIFIVSLTDSYGVTAQANMSLVVTADPPPTFLTNPIAEPWANEGEAYSGSLASNATAAYLAEGDVVTFSKVGGPAWLDVSADGILSGTPQSTDGGSNTFQIAATDFGGSSNTATLSIYVNSPPAFAPESFAKPNAISGEPYSGTIATNATDPDLGAGDVLTFYKVVGPAWLTVATNGALSGSPLATNQGLNSFMVLAVDSGGLAAVGFLAINVTADNPPVFLGNPIAKPAAIAGQPYSASIATNSSDPDFGDMLTFSKVSGPAWLNVAGNGVLSGTPLSFNAGTNTFVVSATDLGGLSTNASLLINVTAVPITLTIQRQGGSVKLAWSGGVPPYQVQTRTNLASAGWQNLGSPSSATNLLLSPSNSGVFYRIQGN